MACTIGCEGAIGIGLFVILASIIYNYNYDYYYKTGHIHEDEQLNNEIISDQANNNTYQPTTDEKTDILNKISTTTITNPNNIPHILNKSTDGTLNAQNKFFDGIY